MVKDSRGSWIQLSKDIESHIVDHFNNMFNSSTSDVSNSDLSSLFPPVITAEDNLQLSRDVSVDEIRQAMGCKESSIPRIGNM